MLSPLPFLSVWHLELGQSAESTGQCFLGVGGNSTKILVQGATDYLG